MFGGRRWRKGSFKIQWNWCGGKSRQKNFYRLCRTLSHILLPCVAIKYCVARKVQFLLAFLLQDPSWEEFGKILEPWVPAELYKIRINFQKCWSKYNLGIRNTVIWCISRHQTYKPCKHWRSLWKLTKQPKHTTGSETWVLTVYPRTQGDRLYYVISVFWQILRLMSNYMLKMIN